MNEILSFWAQWLRPSAGLPTVQWSLLLAVAAMAGYLTQRHTGLPKVVGYSLVGTAAGLAGFSGAVWPLQGIGLFLLELGVAIVLFECGGRIPLRWFRHNPMVLVQSIAESVLTYFAVYWVLVWLNLPTQVAGPLALVALAASPAVLTRVVGAEEQLTTGLELHTEVGLGAAAVAAVTGREDGLGGCGGSGHVSLISVHRCLAQRSQRGKDSRWNWWIENGFKSITSHPPPLTLSSSVDQSLPK